MTAQNAIPCIMMRGGTSRGPYFNAAHLPADRDRMARVLAAAMGSASPLQVDGIGGAQPTTSKTAVLSPSDHDWADIDYLFGQVGIDDDSVDFSPSCGNILAGVGPAALEMGLVEPAGEQTAVRIRNVNTGGLIEAIVETPDSRVRYDGDARIDGVPGTAAPVILNFMNVTGSKTGALFPTGSAIDKIEGIDVTCIDVAMPMVIARATDLGVAGTETREALDADRAFFERIEAIRLEAGRRMGLGDVTSSVVPKFGILAPPQSGGAVTARYFMPWQCHPTYATTGAICTGSCLLAPGTVADGIATLPDGVPAHIAIEHPLGEIDVVFDYQVADGTFEMASAGLLRTARKLFEGLVYVPEALAGDLPST